MTGKIILSIVRTRDVAKKTRQVILAYVNKDRCPLLVFNRDSTALHPTLPHHFTHSCFMAILSASSDFIRQGRNLDLLPPSSPAWLLKKLVLPFRMTSAPSFSKIAPARQSQTKSEHIIFQNIKARVVEPPGYGMRTDSVFGCLLAWASGGRPLNI